MKMPRFTICVLLVAIAACATHQEHKNAFEALEAIRQTYSTLQQQAIQMESEGIISTNAWNYRVAPLDNKIRTTLIHAYGLLRLSISVGDTRDYQSFVNLLKQASQLTNDYAALLNDLRKEQALPAGGGNGH